MTIGAGSWLGHGSIVLPGSRVGRHVVVGGQHGAGAVWVSDDGLAWTRLVLGRPTLGEVEWVGGGPAGWILSTQQWGPSQSWASSDGLTWEPVPGEWPGLGAAYIAPPITVGPDSIASVGRWNQAGTDEWISAVVIGTIRR